MMTISADEKWALTEDIICLTDLALRWPYWAVFKIPLQIGTGQLPIYVWLEEALRPDGRKVHHISQPFMMADANWLTTQMPRIVFLRTSVEEVEQTNPEYLAVKPLLEGENTLFMATEDNLTQIIPLILLASKLVRKDGENLKAGLREMLRTGSDPLIEKILLGNDAAFSIDEVRPTFKQDFEKRRPYTTFERAQDFIKLCATKNFHDQCLAIIEVDKRFPHLTHREIGDLFPSKDDMDGDSLKKRGQRLRGEIEKYKNVPYDHPVP